MIRRRFCALDTIHHAAYNLKACCQMHFIACCTLPSTLWSTLLIALGCTLPACFTIRSQLLSMAHSQPAWLTLPSKLSKRSQVHSEYAPKYTSVYVLEYTPGRAPKEAPNCTRWHTPSVLDYTLPSKLSRRSQEHLWVRTQVHLRVALKYTPEYVLKYTPNCTRWHTPSLLDCTLSSKLSSRS